MCEDWSCTQVLSHIISLFQQVSLVDNTSTSLANEDITLQFLCFFGIALFWPFHLSNLTLSFPTQNKFSLYLTQNLESCLSLALGCLAHFANLWEVTSLDICLRILFYHFQGRCWEPISSWRWRLNSCWVLALDLTMLTHFTPPPASWFQSYPTLSWFLCSRRRVTQHKLTVNLKQMSAV